MERGASNNLWVAETIRMRYAYALAKRGNMARAAALVGEAERIARQKMDAGNEIPALRVEVAAAAALRKNTNGALDWLERAVDAGYRDSRSDLVSCADVTSREQSTRVRSRLSPSGDTGARNKI